MKHKLTVTTILGLLALALFACSPTVDTVTQPEAVEPVAAVAEEEVVVEEMEEMSEEAHSDADGEMATDDDMADGEMAEEEMAESMEAAFAVVPAESTVDWTGRKAVGDFHTGTIDIAEGILNIADGQLVSGEFVLDMSSMASTDGAGSRLLGHLQSDDFFGVETHPTATLVINSAELIDGDRYAVQGDLTIKGITNPIEFEAVAAEADGQVTATADIVFDRALYDVQYGSGTFFSNLGDDLINDEIEISVELVAAK